AAPGARRARLLVRREEGDGAPREDVRRRGRGEAARLLELARAPRARPQHGRRGAHLWREAGHGRRHLPGELASSPARPRGPVYPGSVVGRGRTRALGALLGLVVAGTAGCASPPRAEPGTVSAPATVDPAAIERVARDVRAWLTERYGPARSAPAAIKLVPDPHWFADEQAVSAELPVAISDP